VHGQARYLLKLLKKDQGLLSCLRDVDPTRLDPRSLCRSDIISPYCRRLGSEPRLLALGSLQARVPGCSERL
jgi:hypothetical protein